MAILLLPSLYPTSFSSSHILTPHHPSHSPLFFYPFAPVSPVISHSLPHQLSIFQLSHSTFPSPLWATFPFSGEHCALDTRNRLVVLGRQQTVASHARRRTARRRSSENSPQAHPRHPSPDPAASSSLSSLFQVPAAATRASYATTTTR